MNKETTTSETLGIRGSKIKKSIKKYIPAIKTKTLVIMSMMVSIQFVLERVASIDTPITRLSFTFVGRAVTGALLGPFYSAIVGIAADILGCFYKGYTLNPGITFAAALRGVTFGIFLWRKQNVSNIIAAALFDQFVAGLLVTTVSLFWFGGIPFTTETVLTRLLQCVFIFAIEVIFLLATRKNLFVQIKKYLSVMNVSDRI